MARLLEREDVARAREVVVVKDDVFEAEPRRLEHSTRRGLVIIKEDQRAAAIVPFISSRIALSSLRMSASSPSTTLESVPIASLSVATSAER